MIIILTLLIKIKKTADNIWNNSFILRYNRRILVYMWSG